MYDRFNRTVNYLRVSVTDRCNLRCLYCMPKEGIRLLDHKDILSFEEIVNVVRTAVELGITKVRITGGEPLVRKGITDLIRMISEIDGITDFGLTTNGILLEQFASDLARAGLHRVNISLDTVDPDKFRQITRGGDIKMVFHGIEAARMAGLSPIKINCVVQKSSSELDALEVKRFSKLNDLEVRFIHQMDLQSGCFTVVEGGIGGDCLNCNRLRLTANGFLKPCLFDDLEFSIREPGIREAFEKAINFKPEKGSQNLLNRFHNIGG
jgi:cyclic pyranopterin phosphate synthase